MRKCVCRAIARAVSTLAALSVAATGYAQPPANQAIAGQTNQAEVGAAPPGLAAGFGTAIAAGVATAAPTPGQSLTDALASAYNTNPQLLAERANLSATDENVPAALANWRPTVTVTSSASIDHLYPQGPAAALQFGQTNGKGLTLRGDSFGVNLSQPLYRGGRTVAQTEQALHEVDAERAHLMSVEQSVLLQAITDYADVGEYQATVALNLNNEQVLRRQLEATQDRFEVGEVTRTDVSQAEASYAQAIAGRQAAEGNLEVARANFTRDVGFPPGILPPPAGVPVLPTAKDEAVSIANASNPDVISAQYTLAAAQDNIRLIQGQLLPTVTLTASASKSENTQLPGLREDQQQVGAQFSMPLYEGGAVYAQSRQASQIAAYRQRQLDQARKVAIQTAAAGWEQLRSVRAQIASYEAQIRANTIALEGVQQEASVGERTVLNILDAEQTLFQSRVNLVQSQHDEIIAKFTLASALGELTARHLALPVQYYDPDVHLDSVRDKWIGFGSK